MKKKFTHLTHPRYWLTWLGIAIAWLTTKLPWRLQLAIGKQLGLLMFYVLHSRRKVCCINLALAFPELSAKERKQLTKKHFVSLGCGMIEMFYGWWGNEEKIKAFVTIEGKKHLEYAFNKGKGVILLSAHFTSLELGGRVFALMMPEMRFCAVYRAHKNPVLEHIVAHLRTKQFGQAIPKHNIRGMISQLRKGSTVWYAQDQGYSRKGSLNIPFFGIDAATNPGTSRIAKITGASVVPFFTVRINNSNHKKDKETEEKGYLLRFLPPLDDFPTTDAVIDTTRINQLIEAQIREFPEQYLWTHKRYKKKSHDVYHDYLQQHSKSDCQ